MGPLRLLSCSSCVVLLALSSLVMYFEQVQGRCANNCNANGICDKYGRCVCNKGYTGGDCSLRLCQTGPAWADIPHGNDLAHADMECSNKGVCNRASGICDCEAGYYGAACERMNCAANCNGFGKCYSMLDFAKRTQNIYSETFEYTTIWDASMFAGCKCDYRYSGYDCSLMECPDGDDPLTSGQVNEIQLITCIAEEEGSFFLTYQGYPSQRIDATYTAQMVRTALLQIPILTDISVTFSNPTSSACSKSTNVITVEFTEQFGSLTPLVAIPDEVIVEAKGSVNVFADGLTSVLDGSGQTHVSQKGTKEADSCSRRGICSKADGLCYCFSTNGDAYGSSDGYGSAGNRGDCGTIISGTTVASCPGDTECSGHGVCDKTTGTFRCDCETNWFGGDCSLRSCPTGRSWFDYPVSDQVAHRTWSECSNMGICDTSTGTCSCNAGFSGEACQYMMCGGGQSTQCNNQGVCMSMKQLALYAENNGDATDYTYGSDPNNPLTWDAEKVHGCLCDEGFEGYDCSLRSCPRGKDPELQANSGQGFQVDEEQVLKCVADEGNFKLMFRQYKSKPLSFNITSHELADALRDLHTIISIEVTYVTLAEDYLTIDSTQSFVNRTLCDLTGRTFGVLKFTHTAGDVPAVTADTSDLVSTAAGGLPGSGTIAVTTNGAFADVDTADNTDYTGTLIQSVRGTTENLVCNGRGLCDYSLGKCQCFDGFSGSDGSGLEGHIGDCGYRILRGTKEDL